VTATVPAGPCRGCGRTTLVEVVDLGPQPPAERFPAPDEVVEPLPLSIAVCHTCWLVQLSGPPVHSADEPGGLAFTVSDTMRTHAAGLVADVLARGGPGASVVEIASHGNRLHELFSASGASSILVEPERVYADAARVDGVPVRDGRLTTERAMQLRGEGITPGVVVDAFYLAHDAAPLEILDGIRALLEPDGIAVFEFDYLLPILGETQYDAIRHGHASYLSLHAFDGLARAAGFRIADVSVQPVYGGSLRVVVGPGSEPSEAVGALLDAERGAGLVDLDAYRAFGERVAAARVRLRQFVERVRAARETIAGYGAPSRGNTLLNSSAITVHDIPFTVDRAASKRGRVMPGSRIPILAPDRLRDAQPDYVLVLPWDLRDEIAAQLADLRASGARLVIPLPELEVLA
jgi:C-methyltransferase C-terminal domain/Putative zinc binding domain/Methyltransferase domain